MVDLDLIFDGLRQHFRSSMVAMVDESLTFSGLGRLDACLPVLDSVSISIRL